MSAGVLFARKVSCFYEKMHDFANFGGYAAILIGSCGNWEKCKLKVCSIDCSEYPLHTATVPTGVCAVYSQIAQ